MDWYQDLARPLLFREDAEDAHELTLAALALAPPLLLSLAGRWTAVDDARLEQRLWGLQFRHPLGLAAGLDKQGRAIGGLAALGFSHVEIGTVTGQAQPGNPQPRLFRLPVDQAIINRMGFNNAGAVAMRGRLQARYAPLHQPGPRPRCPLGINIGKSKVTPIEQAVEDHVRTLALVGPWADYLVVNVSSPNTPGLRDLQEESRLRPLLGAVRRQLDRLGTGAPLLVKIAPDLSASGLDAAVDAALETGADGLILTNTTISRDSLRRTPLAETQAAGAGGLSGAPLRLRAEAVLAQVARRLRRSRRPPPLIGVGGIDSVESAWRRIGLGASLLQVYTGLIYHGPGLVRRIALGLGRRLDQLGLPSIADAVGRDL